MPTSQQAIKAYTAQDYDTALQRYTAAQSQAPSQVEPAYNAANTYYRQNVLDKAQQTLEQTLAQPQNAIAQFVHFNLGNIAVQRSEIRRGHRAVRSSPALAA